MRNAYVYVIGWRHLDRWYGGARYREGCDPSDLWTLYYTSSKHVAEFRRLNGEPNVIKVLKTFGENVIAARLHEQHLLRKVHALHSERWLNRAIGGHFAGRYGPHSEATKKKIGDKNRGKKTKTPSKEQIEKQRATFKRNYHHNREARFEKRSKAQKGKEITLITREKIANTLTGRKASDEVRAKISIASRNQTPESREKQAKKMRGRKWFNNGIITVREFECPEGFSPGRLKFKRNKSHYHGKFDKPITVEGVLYKSMTEAMKMLDISRWNLQKILTGKCKTVKEAKINQSGRKY